MNTPDLLVVAAGVFAYALLSRWGERGSLTGPMAFAAFGLAIGTAGLDAVDLSVDGASCTPWPR